jgi:mRNA-degrading endonuclease toxin of MazEF toxin-antitoxin module
MFNFLKDFNSWNIKKKSIQETGKNIDYYHPGEIWWCSLGVNVGDEADGKGENFRRPVLIIKSLSRKTCMIIPLTSSPGDHKYRIDIGIVNRKPAKAILSQMRIIDTKRFSVKIGLLNDNYFQIIRKAISEMF